MAANVLIAVPLICCLYTSSNSKRLLCITSAVAKMMAFEEKSGGRFLVCFWLWSHAMIVAMTCSVLMFVSMETALAVKRFALGGSQPICDNLSMRSWLFLMLDRIKCLRCLNWRTSRWLRLWIIVPAHQMIGLQFSGFYALLGSFGSWAFCLSSFFVHGKESLTLHLIIQTIFVEELAIL